MIRGGRDRVCRMAPSRCTRPATTELDGIPVCEDHAGPTQGVVTCEWCGELHSAEFSHPGRFGEGPIYAVVCTGGDNGWVTDYYKREALWSA